MRSGWIKLHRKLLESAVWSDPWLGWLFVSCLMRANFKETFFRGELIPIGSFAFTYRILSDAFDVDKNRIIRGIKKLEKHGVILLKPGRKFSVITICNYKTYQEADSADRDANADANAYTSADANADANKDANAYANEDANEETEEEGKERKELKEGEEREEEGLAKFPGQNHFNDLATAWNDIDWVPGIKPKSKTNIKAWSNGWSKPEVRKHLKAPQSVIDAVLKSRAFLEGNNWFRFTWLFQRGSRGPEQNMTKLIQGNYFDKSQTPSIVAESGNMAFAKKMLAKIDREEAQGGLEDE